MKISSERSYRSAKAQREDLTEDMIRFTIDCRIEDAAKLRFFVNKCNGKIVSNKGAKECALNLFRMYFPHSRCVSCTKNKDVSLNSYRLVIRIPFEDTSSSFRSRTDFINCVKWLQVFLAPYGVTKKDIPVNPNCMFSDEVEYEFIMFF